ncbi:MAG: HAMP domain-containing sensor histidine kinase [bacterium]|nr:HAMP domain-containing sensor histidine kinase [bacterium]
MKEKFHSRLQLKLIIIFILYSFVIITLSAYYAYNNLFRLLEADLGKRLIQTGASLSGTIHPFQLALGKGSETTETYRNLQKKLGDYKEIFDLNEMIILSTDGRILVSPVNDYKIGDNFDLIRIYEEEFDLAKTGISSTSIIYKGSDGEYYKSGIVPVMDTKGNVIGIIVSEASAKFLDILNKIKNMFITMEMIALITSLIIGWILGKSVTSPINKVVSGLQKIGTGDLQHEILVRTRDEIGFLAHSFNLMVGQLKERDMELRQLAATVAHEVKNPLMGISGSVTLISRRTDDKESLELLDNIHNEIKSLDKLVNEFLTFARFSEPVFSEFDLVRLVEGILSFSIDLIEERKIKIKRNFPESIIMTGDTDKIKRAITNVIQNSIDAMNENGLLRVSITDYGTEILIEIADTGKGIGSEDVNKLFEPFFTTKEKGTGLGLAIVKKIIEQHGGKIEMQANEKIGMRTRITFLKKQKRSGDKIDV